MCPEDHETLYSEEGLAAGMSTLQNTKQVKKWEHLLTLLEWVSFRHLNFNSRREGRNGLLLYELSLPHPKQWETGILQQPLKCHVRDWYGFLSRSADKDFKCRPDWIPVSSCLESLLMEYVVNSEPETHWAHHGVCSLNRGSGRWSSL